MRILGVPREKDDARVALVPETIARLTARGISCLVEHGAGEGAFFSDAEYARSGAELVERARLHERADIVLQVRPHTWEDPRPGTLLIGFLGDREVDGFALERLPRISRAQPMDALTSMATISGYRAALTGAELCPRFFPMLTTAAGTMPPARVLVLGAGVAGLQAMATARRLGAVVSGYDIRPAAREQVHSVGARFVEPPISHEGMGGYAVEQPAEVLRQQQQGLVEVVRQSHVIVATAAVPGKLPPVLVTGEMVEQMIPGAVIVDLAGGNCELAMCGERRRCGPALVVADENVPGQLPIPASQMVSRNLAAFLELILPEVRWEDEIVAACYRRKEALCPT